VSENNKTTIERLDQNRIYSLEHYASLSLKWNELGNNRLADLSKHLFTIAALVLPISLVPVTQGNELLLASFYGKVFLLLSSLSFGLSLLFGMLQLMKESEFYNDWAQQESKKSDQFVEPIQTSNPTIAKEEVNKMHDKADNLDKLSPITPKKLLWWQMWALLAGMIFIGATLVTVMFENNNSTNSQNECQQSRTQCSKRLRHHYYFR